MDIDNELDIALEDLLEALIDYQQREDIKNNNLASLEDGQYMRSVRIDYVNAIGV